MACLLILSSCGQKHEPALTRELQQSLTIAEILEELKKGNERFVRGEHVPMDYVKDMKAITHDYVLMGLELTTDEEYAGMG